MAKLVFSLVANALALLLTAYLVPGFHVASFTDALIAAAVLGVFNTILRPILSLLSLPITILTLGLFSWVISAIIILLVSAIVPGFKVDGFLSALIGGILLAFVSSLFQSLVRNDR